MTEEQTADGSTGSSDRASSRRWYRRFRSWVRERPGVDRAYRITVAVTGVAMLIVGLAMTVYPGPGFLVVLAGLGLWATEFHWARQVLNFVRRQYNQWIRWMYRQPPAVRLLVMALLGLVALASLWLANAFELVADWVGLDWPWVQSPLM